MFKRYQNPNRHHWRFESRILTTPTRTFSIGDRRFNPHFALQCYKHFKWELHHAYYNPNVTKEKMLEKMPKNVTNEQWINLASYWCSEKFKTLSSLGKRTHGIQDQVCMIGSQSYACGKRDFVERIEDGLQFMYAHAGFSFSSNTLEIPKKTCGILSRIAIELQKLRKPQYKLNCRNNLIC
ncbi:uncharacterized protein LOC130826918 [Amaranthus tricolor]|uniref:uncharacterized protein LOC130826918 n=1 Tax=Amaranthus tricolor TaxID=29722 RepID=UPI0025849F35|nr:uncharacterized protein LOC130826918 [Amaranthus tricolor]